MNSFNFIKSTFLRLTSKTYPYGLEDDLLKDTSDIFPKLEKDKFGNYFHKIGNSRTMFAAHLDTACTTQERVVHVIDDQFVRTDGRTILGADDKGGVTILLWLIKNNVPGLYYFFIGEEVGCVGSGDAAMGGGFKGNYDRVICFDRSSTSSVITFQCSYRTCSDEFAKELSYQLNLKTDLNYKPDDTGLYTDSSEFVDSVPECTNISVGYYKQHTVDECQDLYHLNKLALAVLDVDWEKLPVCRDITKSEPKRSYHFDDYSYGNFATSIRKELFCSSDTDYDDYGNYSNRTKKKLKNSNRKGRSFYDAGHGLVEIESKSDNEGVMDSIKVKFLISDLTKKEWDLVDKQYINLDKDSGTLPYGRW